MSVSVDGWRLTQVFLSKKPAVFEVEMNIHSLDLRCTCPGYVRFRKCKHTAFVAERISLERRAYPLDVWQTITPEDTEEAEKSPETYRKFILRVGKVEVL